MKWNRFGRWSTAAVMFGAAGLGCLSRPVGKQPPTTKVNFTSTISQQAVDKVDLLFAIDNSASMGDKQAILAEAVPDLIQGLLNPNCVSKTDATPSGQRADPAGNKENNYGCPEGTEPEFTPVTDMHIGIVSSSLGNFGGDVCPKPAPGVFTDDGGHLINRKQGGGTVANAEPSNFLAWFPEAKANEDKRRHPDPPVPPIKTVEQLTNDFKDLVVGVDQNGCGLEAQLESMYRFLIQPDPWASIKLDGYSQADLGEEVDFTVLKQRADFLRPDSLVAVIMLTDEDDSSADPLAIGGQGWAFMAKNFPGSNVYRGTQAQGTTAPRGTTQCATDPGAKDEQGNDLCTSCGFQEQCDPSRPDCQRIKNDPNCRESGQNGQAGKGFDGYYGPTDDELNVRFHRMKERYGIDPQYPIQRYIDGFTKYLVPDRKTEHQITMNGDRRIISNYSKSAGKCTNPLFAAKLPVEATDTKQLCDLPRSTRTPDLVFFAVVGGVPHQLLYPSGYDTNNFENNRMTEEKWVTILGKDPEHFNYEGIDAHMIQSVTPRGPCPNCSEATKGGLAGEKDLARGQNGSDVIHGREWNTNKSDLQYACTFDLGDKKRTCGQNDQSCDCTPDQNTNPPLCGTGTEQIKAKAYPTIREFEVVRALKNQGIAASLCPIQLTDPTAQTYGYRPAVAAIIDRLKNALTTQCLPQKLKEKEDDPNAPVPCLVLAQLADQQDNCERYGLQPPPDDILKVFREQQALETGNVVDGGLDLAKLPVCNVPQRALPRGETCKDEAEKVFCYVENDLQSGKNPAGRCPQALIFSTGTQELVGARFSLQCIKQFAAGVAAGDTPQQ